MMIAIGEDSGEEIIETKMIIVGEIITEIVGIEGIGTEVTEETTKGKEAEVLKNIEAKAVAEAMKKEENIETEVLQIQVIVD